MLQFDWQRHYCGYFTSTACVTDQTRRATRAGSGYARLAITSVDIISSLPGCDHEALKFSLCLDPPSQPKTNRVLFNFKAADFDHFRDILGNVPWQLSESDDVDVWWTQWKDLFLAAAYDAIPSVKWKCHKMKR